MQIVTTKASTKVAAVATALAMASSMLSFAPMVHAETAAACSVGTTDLTVNSTGPAVECLQKTLVAGGYLVMPAGVNYGFFGQLTKSAVMKWQVAKGITPAAGYFGPISRAAFSPATGGNTGTGTGTSTGGALEGGAGDITVTERSSGVADEVLEGEEEAKVLGFDIEAEGSDVAVTSVKVELEHTGAGSTRLNRYVEEVQVMQGNKVVGTADASDFSENGDVYSRSISLKGAVVDEDETERFHIAVTAVGNIDSDDLSENWDVTLAQTRFTDAEGAVLTDTTANIAETFTFEDLSTSGDVELSITEDDEDVNKAHPVMVDDTSDTNDVELLSFALDADGSDISVKEIAFTVTSSGAGVTEIANDFRLMMGDEEVGNLSFETDQSSRVGGDSMASSTDTTVALIFEDLDDDDVMIEEGDSVTFTVVADINDVDGGFSNSDSMLVALASADVDAEDANGDDADVTGSATSEGTSFQSTGIAVKMISSKAEPVLNLDSTSTDDQGKYEVTFDVTAIEDTSWISLTAASSTSANTDNVGIAFGMENASNGNSVMTGTTSSMTLARVSGGSVSGNFVRINAGQTARFTLTTYYDSATTGSYRVQLDSVGYNQSSAAAPDAEYDVVPVSDYESAAVQILN